MFAFTPIVGYSQGELRNGFKPAGAQFVAVSGDAIDLTDIKVVGYDAEEGTEADVKIQILDAYGMGGDTYSFYDVPGELTAWLDGDDEEVEAGTVVLAAGEGMWVRAPNSSFSLQTAGQVPTSGISVTLRSGYKIVVNNTPVAVDLTDIDVTGYDAEEGTEADVKVQILDAYGMGGDTYSYYDVPGELTAWLDGDDEEVEVGYVVVGAGEGLWVRAPSTSFKMVLPGVTL